MIDRGKVIDWVLKTVVAPWLMSAVLIGMAVSFIVGFLAGVALS